MSNSSHLSLVAERALLPLSERSDDELMLLSSAGQATAFSQIVARHASRLRNYCARLVGNLALAEELAQDTWLAIWNARARYSPEGKFSIYLYVAARNRCFNLSRAEKGRAQIADDDVSAVVDPNPSQVDAMIAAEKRRRVQRALERIGEKYRDVLVLRFSEGLDYPDIARIVRRSEAAVRTRVHVGIEQLRKQIEKGGAR